MISGYTQTLLTDKDINQTIRDKFLEKIATNANKMTTMIDRLRLSIRLDDGQMETKMRSVNLKTLILHQIDDLKSTYPARDISFEGDDIEKEVDETLVGVAIINIIENALKYSQDRIFVKLDNEKISVVDNGIGINQNEIENITKKFYRVSTNGWNNSLGVGLSLVQNILNGHNFKLHIESIENEGSTFEIVF
ncbi:MAG: HAMP domain-containing histidine kinase [Arcobacter sp.]|nr:HAMP domain-containing histidine kinase [Arcobacter sp.]